MEEDRLWKFRKPVWLNSAWARSAGVYSAGALVRFDRPFATVSSNARWPRSVSPLTRLISRLFVVLTSFVPGSSPSHSTS